MTKAWEIKVNSMVNVPVTSYEPKGVKHVTYTPSDRHTGSYEYVTFEFFDGTTLTIPSNEKLEVLNDRNY